jgi:hypothetical protein
LEASFAKLPLSFEANAGQTNPAVKFLSHGKGYTLFLTGDEAVLSLKKSGVRSQESEARHRRFDLWSSKFKAGLSGSRLAGLESPVSFLGSPSSNLRSPLSSLDSPVSNLKSSISHTASPAPSLQPPAPSVVRMKLVGANPGAKVSGAAELPGKANYFIGNDPRQWRSNVPTYAQVKYRNVYPGIDLVYYGNQGGQLEYDFVVNPGADPNAIALDVGTSGQVGSRQKAVGSEDQQSGRQKAVGSNQTRIAAHGDLIISTDDGEVRFHKPLVYQEQDSGFRIQGQTTKREA